MKICIQFLNQLIYILKQGEKAAYVVNIVEIFLITKIIFLLINRFNQSSNQNRIFKIPFYK
jgi:hypothetical protein